MRFTWMHWRPTNPRWVWLASAALLYCAGLVVLRGRPTIRGDAGVFLSVGALVARGARLYVGVWDNKPPLFYYNYAIAILAGGWRGPFLLDIVWLWVACVSMGLLLRALGASRATCAIGLVVYPVLLTGAWYYAGYSELPAVALLTLTAYLWMRGSRVIAGVTLGLLAFLHPEYCIVAVAVMAAPVVAGTLRGRALVQRTLGLVLGAGATVVVLVAIMAARGEFAGYVSTMWSDLGYPDRHLAFRGLPTGVAGHFIVLRRAVDVDVWRRESLILLLVWGAAWGVVWRVTQHRSSARRGVAGARSALVACWVLATVSSVAVLLLTLLSAHNTQLMALPGVLAICGIAAWIQQTGLPRGVVLPAVLLTIAIGIVAFGGLVVATWASGGSTESPQPLSAWTQTPLSVTAQVLNRGAKISGKRAEVTYARLGVNDDDAHGAFIAGDLRLACPIFAQYPFNANLDQARNCLTTARPDLVVEGPEFGPYTKRGPLPTYEAHWTAFVDQSLAVLAKNYVVVSRTREAGGEVVLWCSRQVCRAAASRAASPARVSAGSR